MMLDPLGLHIAVTVRHVIAFVEREFLFQLARFHGLQSPLPAWPLARTRASPTEPIPL